MTTRVLIVDPDIAFAVPVKRALEQSGNYSVSVFANGKAALELIQRQPQDIAVLDFRIDDMPLPALIAALRAIQPGLFILTSPRTEADIAQLPSLNTQGSITKPYYARQLEPVIRQTIAAKSSLAKQLRKENKSEGKKSAQLPPEPPVEPDDTFRRMISTMYSGDITQKSQPISLDAEPQPKEPIEQPTAPSILDEPPVGDDATIRDLVSGQTPVLPIESAAPPPPPPVELLDILLSEPQPSSEVSAKDTTAREEVAALALDAASDDTIPFESLSLPEFIARVEQELGDKLPTPLPVPSWAQQAQLPEVNEPPIEVQDTPIFAKSRVISSLPGETQPTGGVVQEELEREQPEAEPDVPERTTETVNAQDIEDSADSAEATAEQREEQAAPPTAFAPSSDVTPVAELAVQLTQWTVGSAAAATLVTRGSTLIASAGQLSPQDVAGAVALISAAWPGEPEKGASLVRFIHVPEAGDYLLYSIVSAESLILSMLFPADMPLKIIRKQARDLLNALERVPEPPASTEPPAAITLLSRPTDLRPPEGLRQATAEASEAAAGTVQSEPPRAEGPYAVYTFVWLPQEGTLDPDLAELLVGWLVGVIDTHTWQLEGMDIQRSYVAAQISIPANESPSATIETLLHETAERAGQGALWADAYYIVAPGRAVTDQEIAQFVEFQRSAA